MGDKWQQFAHSSRSHNVILIDQKDQLTNPKKTNQPMDEAHWAVTEEFDFARKTHTQFQGLDGAAAHTRIVVFLKEAGCWVVLDHIETDRPRNITAMWRFRPEREVVVDADGNLFTADVEGANLGIKPLGEIKWHATLIRGQEEPYLQGWYSEVTTEWVPNTCVEFTAQINDNAVFAWIVTPSRQGSAPLPAEATLDIEQDTASICFTDTNGRTISIEIPFDTGRPRAATEDVQAKQRKNKMMQPKFTSVRQEALFEHDGQDFFRIPGLLVTREGTLLAFCQQRKGSVSDHGHESDNLVRRSDDGGATWSPAAVIATKPGIDVHNGPAVQDRHSGRIFKFSRYWPIQNWKEVLGNTPYARMRESGLIDHVAISDDDGQTWSRSEAIAMPFPQDATSTGTGNGMHGIQLANGDLAIAAGYRSASGVLANVVLLSSDGGKTWRTGAADPKANSAREFIFAQLADGSVYCNFRNNVEGNHRLISRAPADMSTFGDIHHDTNLPEPVAHAGISYIPAEKQWTNGILLFSNPNVHNVNGGWNKYSRQKMTVRASLDGGATWQHALEIWDGPAAYSDIAVTCEEGEWFVHVLYEQGDGFEETARYSKRIVHALLPLSALLASKAQDFPPMRIVGNQ